MESLRQSLGWGSAGGRGGYHPPGLKAGDHSGYLPASVSLLGGESDDDLEGEGLKGGAYVGVVRRVKRENDKDDELLNLQLAKLDKSYQKFTLKNKQSGYQQDGLLQDKSPNQDSYGGYNSSENFQGFGEEKKQSRKDSDDWGSGWEDSGWSESPQKPAPSEKTKASRPTKTTTKGKKVGNEGLLIDFGEEKKKEKDDWEDNWEDEAWQSLGKDD